MCTDRPDYFLLRRGGAFRSPSLSYVLFRPFFGVVAVSLVVVDEELDTPPAFIIRYRLITLAAVL